MAEFPATPKPSYPIDIESEWKTLKTTFDSGKEQRRQKWDYAKYNVTLKYDVLTPANIQLLWAFYQARKGSAESFYFYDLVSVAHTSLYIGIGDGVTLIWDVPGKSTSSETIYVNGAEFDSGYEILTGGGSESSDRISFTVEPAEGDIITCDFTGFLRIPCRFEEDKMSRESFTRTLYRTGLKLKGLAF
jgi:uncharacterized protein (TIGR02217 family)